MCSAREGFRGMQRDHVGRYVAPVMRGFVCELFGRCCHRCSHVSALLFFRLRKARCCFSHNVFNFLVGIASDVTATRSATVPLPPHGHQNTSYYGVSPSLWPPAQVGGHDCLGGSVQAPFLSVHWSMAGFRLRDCIFSSVRGLLGSAGLRLQTPEAAVT